jgi:HD superfamily phosphohydrolase
MDYLIRDSYFCGISYGNFDSRWIFHTMRVGSFSSNRDQPMWLEKAIRALEDYIFARYNMYWAVYYHRTTRGYEELLKAILRRAKDSHKKGKKIVFISNQLRKFILQEQLSCDDYLSIDDSILLSQVSLWKYSRDKALSDLSSRFISRKGLKWIDYREDKIDVSELRGREDARNRIEDVLKSKGYDPKYYFLDSVSAAKAYDCYHPEKETGDRSEKNSIFIIDRNKDKIEISMMPEMHRLRALIDTKEIKKFYYVPEECRGRVIDILDKMY